MLRPVSISGQSDLNTLRKAAFYLPYHQAAGSDEEMLGRRAYAGTVLASLCAIPQGAAADSRFQTQAATYDPPRASLDFTIVVPEYLAVRINDGPAGADDSARMPVLLPVAITNGRGIVITPSPDGLGQPATRGKGLAAIHRARAAGIVSSP